MYVTTLDRYYSQAVPEQFDHAGVIDYARWAEKTFYEEEARAKKFLVPTSKYTEPQRRATDRLIQTVLNEPRILEALTAAAHRLIEEHRSEPLSVIYRLLDRLPTALDPLVAAVQAHIVRKGKEDMVESAAVVAVDPEKYVEKLLCLYQAFVMLVKDAFKDDFRFTSARDRGFQEVGRL